MTYSYNMSNLVANGTDRMRFELGDTDPNNVLLQDEELRFCLAQASGFYRACAMAAYSVARRFAREASVSVGGMSVALSDRAKGWREMADQFVVEAEEEMPPLEPSAGGLPDPSLRPDFGRGIMDNPATVSPYSSRWGGWFG